MKSMIEVFKERLVKEQKGKIEMSLAIVIVALLVWAGYAIIKAIDDAKPAVPIEDMEEHLKYLQSLPNEEARRRYLRNRKPGDK